MTKPRFPASLAAALVLSAAAGAWALASGSASARQQSLNDPGSAFVPAENPGNWPSVITRTQRGHLIGNPAAETRLIEFISYTCPHCTDFAARGEPVLEIVLLKPGKIAVEVRPVIRNGLDTIVTLLAQCGDPAGFKARHQALILSQANWVAKARNAPQTQQAVWERGDKSARMNAASALGLTDMLANRGQSRAELDACVMDDAAAARLKANTEADAAELGVTSTPSFVLDGTLLKDVHSWEELYPVLSQKFTPTSP